jgi:hypothetical protein
MKDPNERFPLRAQGFATPHDPAPVHCIVGDTVCQVRVWSEKEWERLDPADRPDPAEHVPGLGWVGAVLGQSAK